MVHPPLWPQPETPMSEQLAAVSRFVRAVSSTLCDLAADLESAPPAPQPTGDQPEIPLGRGARQQQILDLPGLLTEQGMKTADIAAAIDYQQPNTWSTLRSLDRAGLVELVGGRAPQRWRLATRYRATVAVFIRIAAQVHAGEWTTDADISLAARGDTKAARTVARAAGALAQFPHPERVLTEGGVISPAWRDSDGHDHTHCRRLLHQQGVRFSGGRADPGQRVTWDELHRRDRTQCTPG